MGMLADSLKPPSAYRVKKDQPGLWDELVDRVNGAVLAAQLDELETWLEFRPLDLPPAWVRELQDRIDEKREELAKEDIGNILLDRFDFK